MSERKHVIVTTQYKGVYYGRLADHDEDKRTCRLLDAHMAMRWGTQEGVDQLAVTGPTDKSRLGTRAPRIWLCGLTSVVECTPKAVEEWTRRTG